MGLKEDMKKAATTVALLDPILGPAIVATTITTAATTAATVTSTVGGIAPDGIKIMSQGSNNSTPAIAEKTETPPTDEKPIYILCYGHAPMVEHVAAVYDKERIDYYPKNVADNTAALSDIGNILLNQNTESIFKPTSEMTQTCYAVYPSQLGLDASQVENAFKEVKQEKAPYNFYNNNCADQIIKVFEKCGVDMSKNKFCIASLPADVRNFALKNGYKVSPEDIPSFADLHAEMKKDAEVAKQKTPTDVQIPDFSTIADKYQKRSYPDFTVMAYRNSKQNN